MTVRIPFFVSARRAAEWAEAKNVFFILSMGRSGTAFLARLLNQDPRALVAHEPVLHDFRAIQEARHSAMKALRYIEHFRKKEIYLRARGRDVAIYGEVNSLLRHHASALRRAFPSARLIHLVRDGRDVVRSIMSRRTLTADDPHAGNIFPQPQDPWFESWESMGRFERVCWYWQHENAVLRQEIADTIQLERLLCSYEYFDERVLAPCSLSVPLEEWSRRVGEPQNATPTHRMAAWPQWTAEQRQLFSDICGEEMRANGYRLEDYPLRC